MHAGADAPDVEVHNPRIAGLFDQVAHSLQQMLVGRIEQDRRRLAHQDHRPTGDDHRSDNADHRIEPHPAEVTPAKQSCDRKHRCQRVRKDVHVGRSQIVIVVMMTVPMIVIVMVVPMRKKGSADEINDEPDHRDKCGIAEIHPHGIH